MRPEQNPQPPDDRSYLGFFRPGSLVAPLHRGRGKKRNIRHHQPQQPTVRESGVASPR